MGRLSLLGAGTQGGFSPAQLSPLLWYKPDESALADGARSFALASSQAVRSGTPTGITLGTEANLMVGAWVWFDSVLVASGELGIISQYRTDTALRSWRLVQQHNGIDSRIRVIFSPDGTSAITHTATTFGALSTGQWYFVAFGHSGTSDEVYIRVATTATAPARDTVAHSAGIFAISEPINLGVAYQNGAAPTFLGYLNGRIDSAFIAQPASLDGSSFDSFFTTLWNNGAGVCYPQLSSSLKTSIGLKSFYCLNEDSGGAFDAHGANHCLNAVTAYPTTTPGIAAGQASDGNFSNTFVAGSGQYFSIADNPSFATGDIDLWCAAWVNPTGTIGADRVVICQYDLNSQRSWALQYANTGNVWRFTVSPDGLVGGATSVSASTFGTPPTNTWQFLFAYHDSVTNTVNISINGGAFDSAAHSTGIHNSTSIAQIGAFINGGSAGAFFDGRIDSACFGKSPPGGIAAIATTIRDTLFNAGRGVKAAAITSAQRTAWGGVSFWNLEESSGNALDSWGTNHLTPSASRPTRGLGVAYYEGAVTRVLNSGSYAGDLSQSTLAKRPTYNTTLFSRGALNFDGVDDLLHFTLNNANPPSSATQGAWFSVVRFNALTQYSTFASFGDDDANGDFLAFRLGGAAYSSTNRIEICEQVAGPQRAVNGNTVIAANTPYVIGIISNGSAWRIRVNGVEQTLSVGAGSNTGGWLSKSVSMDNITLGCTKRLSESEFANVVIAETIMLPSAPSASDIANIETYLNSRYGVY